MLAMTKVPRNCPRVCPSEGSLCLGSVANVVAVSAAVFVADTAGCSRPPLLQSLVSVVLAASHFSAVASNIWQ